MEKVCPVREEAGELVPSAAPSNYTYLVRDFYATSTLQRW